MAPKSPTKKRYVNKKTRRNQVIFAIALIVVQLVVSVVYGIVGKVSIQTINMASVLTAIFMAMLVVVGTVWVT
jgi:heme/copper-type cytochrome/quinol oxidase subunit 4